MLFEELAELTGQRNAIDGRIVDIVAEIDHDGIWGNTGCRSLPALIAWKTGTSLRNAETVAAIAHRSPELPQCTAALRAGQLSLDQVGVIAERAGEGSDAHYAQLAASATVAQLRTAIKLEPRPDPEPKPTSPPPRAITKTDGEQSTTWRITLPHPEAATFDAALQSHHDGLVAQWKRDHADDSGEDGPDPTGPVDDRDVQLSPLPTRVDGFMSLVEAGWDADVARRPHGQRTTVVVHLDVESRVAALHLGPLLPDGDRQYLTCDATCEVWFERHGRPIGSGRETRVISRRLRRALEHRDHCCVVPGCAATRGLHAHHLVHWEDGGPTELANLVLVCPYHHRLHHRGLITLRGPAHHLLVTNAAGEPLTSASLARSPTTPPPRVAPCRGPTGERADWWWYDPFETPPPPSPN
ncbi:hypothetical protein MMAD_35450 [Mycolicibacterium madagascariense]|uniref:HNH nuclease domain-containing protein n=1 Tax=Mycolicibacterium madagascariense TaxID=212765 RepID=A0A7I7XJ83_9MYCO|nr:hypothetical protein MMAD_35450 [Mycolicibacterium madagascariense]